VRLSSPPAQRMFPWQLYSPESVSAFLQAAASKAGKREVAWTSLKKLSPNSVLSLARSSPSSCEVCASTSGLAFGGGFLGGMVYLFCLRTNGYGRACSCRWQR